MRSTIFLGVPIDGFTIDGAVERCLEILERRQGPTATLVHVNPHTLVEARSDPSLREALITSDLRLADGAGLLLVARLRGEPLPERVAAPDFLPRLSDALDRRGGARYFFYGSTAGVLERIEGRVRQRWPSIRIAGTFAPPFRSLTEEEETEHVRLINAARPDLLWVGMTAPKQERWVHRNRARIEAPLVASVGAAFDYLAGTKVRGSRWFREHGLEWLPRLLREPRRLWRRTVLSAPLFLWYSFLESASRHGEAPR